jgi:hypothetical protein
MTPSIFINQITINLSNTLNTFGASSHQYKAVLQTLKDFLQNIGAERGTTTTYTSSSDDKSNNGALPDPDMLSLAMGYLKLEE